MAAPSEMSDDDISITSTAASDEQEEYDVEAVVAEKEFDGEILYLVKWEGYPMERCTWEPEDSFCDPQTLRDWSAKKDAITQGKEQPFDADALMEKIEALDDAKALRQQKRKEKRKRLGTPVSPQGSSERSGKSPSFDGFIVEDDQIDEGFHQRHRKRRREENMDLPSDQGNQKANILSKARQTSPRPKTLAGKTPSRSSTQTLPRDLNKPTKESRPSLNLTTNPGSSVSGLPTSRRSDRILMPDSSNIPAKPTSPARPASSAPTLFRNMSTKRRHEKATRRDRAPDISQLDLRAPGEWTSVNQNSAATAPPAPRTRASDSDNLFVEQDDPIPPGASPNLSCPTSAVPAGEKRKDSQQDRPPDVGGKPASSRGNFATPSNRFTGNRRFWQPGEVMAHFKLSPIDKAVGDVRLQALNPKSREELIQLKSKGRITLDFRHTCTLNEYTELCKSGFNMSFANTAVLGYDDTAPALNEATNYLKSHDLAALWYHPSDEAQLVLVAYAYESHSWSFLHQDSALYPPHGLRIVARGTLPPFDSLQNVEHTPVTPRDTRHSYSNTEPVSTTIADVGNGTHIEPSPSPPAQHPAPKHNDPRCQVAEGVDLDVVSVFSEKFNISFTGLIPEKSKGNGSRCPFYLCFPEGSQEVETELELFKCFLKHYGVPVFTNRSDDDWDRFYKMAESGTLVFHETYVFYENIPNLNHILQRPFNIFNVSLGRHIEDANGLHLQPLFPKGGVILITEDIILQDPTTVLKVLHWFQNFVGFSHHWKLFFRPNVQRWLFNLFDSWPDDSMYQIYSLVKDLIPDYPRNHANYNKRSESPDSLDGLTDDEGQHHPIISMSSIRSYGSRSEAEHDAIPRGLSQEERNTDHLVEYFAGWSLINCNRYRKFYVLTHFHPQPRWLKWHHLVVMNGNQFLKNLQGKERKNTSGGHRSQAHANSNSSKRRSSAEIPIRPSSSRSAASSTQQPISPAISCAPFSRFSTNTG